MKKILYIIGMAAVLAGCSEELGEEPGAVKPGDQVAVTFGASLTAEVAEMAASPGAGTPVTRAFSDAYAGRIGVLTGDSWVTTPADYSNIGLTIASDGIMTTTPAEALLTSGNAYTFCSVAVPRGALPAPTGDVYPLTFGKVTDSTDLIYATTTQTINRGEQISLAYSHVYGKVKFVLAPGEWMTAAELAAATLTVSGYYAAGTLSLKTGAVAGTTPGADVAVDQNTAYYAIPQTFTGTAATATVTVGNKTYIGGITTGDITAGRFTTITIRVTGEEPPPSSVYVGMFGGEMTGSGTEADPYQFSRPLYVQPGDASAAAKWATVEGDHSALAGSTTDGRANTWSLNKGAGGSLTRFPAANLCFNKNSDGEKASADALAWYLPAQEQLMGIWVTHSANTFPFGSIGYWSSSEDYSGSNWCVDFNDGITDFSYYSFNDNPGTNRVRCVREVTP